MKKMAFRISIVCLVFVLILLCFSLLQGIVEFKELASKGKDLINKNESNSDSSTTPPESDPFVAVDTSLEASENMFFAEVGVKTGVQEDAFIVAGPMIGETLDGLSVFENGSIRVNNLTPDYFYEVGIISGDMLVYPTRLYYRLFQYGEWSSHINVVDGSNIVVYLASYDGETQGEYQRYDGSFSASNPHVSYMVAIGFTEDFLSNFDSDLYGEDTGFRLYALAD